MALSLIDLSVIRLAGLWFYTQRRFVASYYRVFTAEAFGGFACDGRVRSVSA
jgi:hypothetical protein